MNDQVIRRLQELKSEYRSGEEQLKQLDDRRTQLTQTLLRISGAIQVLEEIARDLPTGEHETA